MAAGWRAAHAESRTEGPLRAARAGFAGFELPFPHLPGDRVEDGIDEPRLVLVVETVGQLDILRDHHAGWHVCAEHELVGAGPEGRAQHGLDALQRPSGSEDRVDLAIHGALLAHDAREYVAEERVLSRLEADALALAPDPEGLELGEGIDHALPGELHLIEGLDGGEAGGAALRGLRHL